MCAAHYRISWKGGDPAAHILPLLPEKECVIDGCILTTPIGKLCGTHERAIRAGKMAPPPGVNIQTHGPCTFGECDRPSQTKRPGLCKSHRAMLAATGELVPLQGISGAPCTWPEGCPGPSKSKGRCARHYGREPKPARRECETAGCPTRTSLPSGHCTPHNRQLEKWGETWMPGDKPNWTTACAVPWCEELSYHEGGICVAHNKRRSSHRITPETFARLFEVPACGGCGSGENLCIDHDHACCPGDHGCNQCARGLLCRDCNFALGFLKDDRDRLLNLMGYLSRAEVAIAA